MFLTVIKKMINNQWMTACLFTGFFLVVAMVSSIPLYTGGILQKLLTADLENYQKKQNIFPGYYTVKANFQNLESVERPGLYTSLKNNLINHLLPEFPLPVLTIAEEITLDNYSALPAVQRENPPVRRSVSLRSIPDLEKHITLTRGTLFSSQIQDGTIDVMVTEKFLINNNFQPGEVIHIHEYTNKDIIKVKITGVFSITDYQDTFWVKNLDYYDFVFFIDHSLYEREFLKQSPPVITKVEWNVALDYHRITINNVGAIISILEKHHRLVDHYRQYLNLEFTAEPILLKYLNREKQLKFTLWIIEVPVLILLFFYVFMISNLIITNERNEIAILKSRGKSTFQVFLLYLFESLILSFIALLCGPPLGYIICKFMGASNGFLEFVRRISLPLTLDFSPYLYSCLILLFLIITIMFPVFFAAKTSIVQLKQQKAGKQNTPVWKRFSIDILILGISGYGFYRYQSQQSILKITGAGGVELGIDPLLFLTSTLFILGTGLLFLRIFPLLIRMIYRIGKKYWSPPMYCAILQVARTGEKGQFFMLFLIFSIAIGILSANMARTLNRNMEDRIRYRTGADITMQPAWLSEAAIASMDIDTTATDYSPDADAVSLTTAIHYLEPSFIPFTQLKGAEKVTKVFRKSDGKVLSGDRVITEVQIQGIVPHEFGETAWFRDDLLPYHWYHYLNLLSESPSALLLSRNFETREKLKPGDSVIFTRGNQQFIQGTVYAFVDFWPAYNPYESTDFNSESFLIVANLQYLQNKLAREPYQIWIKKREGSTDETLYEDIRQKTLAIEEINSVSQEIIKQKNDPLLLGINGALTLGFILIMFVCIIGFLIYWILSLQSRKLQFGIFRAIGLSRRKVISIIILEQIMMSGVAIFMGIIIGGIASYLFVPFLQLVFSSVEQVPPFHIVALRSDYLKIYSIVGIILGTGFVILRFFINRLKIGSALKLGED
ncbi:MAG: ABC transporter permease [Spirochaetales bacterium]|nr:ABC transporter permease [Spirochaetales bacterium]